MSALRIVAAAALLSAVAGSAFAAPDMAEDSPVMPRPASPLVQAFVQDAGISNQFEMTEAQMALEKSQDPNVRAFAQRMLQDHHMAEFALERAAAPSGVVTHFMFDPAHQSRLVQLEPLTGKAFDEAYWNDQREAHVEAVAALGDYAASGSDPALRAFARQTLPVVQMHQSMITSMTGVSPLAMQ
jgi:putative membrane protein